MAEWDNTRGAPQAAWEWAESNEAQEVLWPKPRRAGGNLVLGIGQGVRMGFTGEPTQGSRTGDQIQL